MAPIEPTAPDKLMTPANIVTLIRICLVPVFVLAIVSPWPLWMGLPDITTEAKRLIDRIAANGDVANKIGTLGVAVAAARFGVPFYVAAPLATVDASVPDGAAIPIEERDAAEVLARPIEGVEVFNPAFDVTPAALITAIITEKGVWHPGS